MKWRNGNFFFLSTRPNIEGLNSFCDGSCDWPKLMSLENQSKSRENCRLPFWSDVTLWMKSGILEDTREIWRTVCVFYLISVVCVCVLEIFWQNNIAEVKITMLVGGSRFFSVSRKYPKMNKRYEYDYIMQEIYSSKESSKESNMLTFK